MTLHVSALRRLLIAGTCVATIGCGDSPTAPEVLQDLTGRWRGFAQISSIALPTPLEMTLTDAGGQLSGTGGGVDCRFFLTCGFFYSYVVSGSHDASRIQLTGETPDRRTWTLTGTLDARGQNVFCTIGGPELPVSPCQMAKQP